MTIFFPLFFILSVRFFSIKIAFEMNPFLSTRSIFHHKTSLIVHFHWCILIFPFRVWPLRFLFCGWCLFFVALFFIFFLHFSNRVSFVFHFESLFFSVALLPLDGADSISKVSFRILCTSNAFIECALRQRIETEQMCCRAFINFKLSFRHVAADESDIDVWIP